MLREERNGSLTKVGERAGPVAGQDTNASYLPAMAHFGQSFIPLVILARDHVVAITTLLKVAKKGQEEVPDAALRNLEVVAQALQDVQMQFKAEFLRELRAHAASTGPNSRASRTDGVKRSGNSLE